MAFPKNKMFANRLYARHSKTILLKSKKRIVAKK